MAGMHYQGAGAGPAGAEAAAQLSNLAKCVDAFQLAPAHEGPCPAGRLSRLRKRKNAAVGIQEQLSGPGRKFGAPLARTLSVEESARSSASLGTGLASEWRARLLGDSEDDGDSPASLLRFSMPLSEEMEAGGKRRRVTPQVPHSLGHLCSVAAALSSDSASPAQCLASSTPDACEAAQPPHSCPSPSCPEPELHVSTGEELSSASSSDLDSSSPDSCYEQAFICDAGAPMRVAAPLPGAPVAMRLQGSSTVRRQQQLPQPCALHVAPPRAAPRQQRRPLGQAEVYRFGQSMQLRSSRLSVAGAPRECQRTRSSVARHAVRAPAPQPASDSPSAPYAPPVPAQAQPAATALRIAAIQTVTSAPAQPEPVPAAATSLAVPQGDQPAAGGDTTVAVANLMAGHSLARLPPAQLALLIANHNGSDPVLTQALQCAMAALSDAQLGAVGCALQELNRALRGPAAHRTGVVKAQRLQPGAPEAVDLSANPASTAMITGVKAPAYNVLRMPRPLLPAQAQVQLELCRALQAGASAAVCAPSWLQVLTMWSRGTDMAQADTPAFALHLWTRVQPLVSAEHVVSLGAVKPWETVVLACLWVAAKHEEARRALPPASRMAPLASCNARTLCAVEIHILELVRWAPLHMWDDRHHSKGVRVSFQELPPSA